MECSVGATPLSLARFNISGILDSCANVFLVMARKFSIALSSGTTCITNPRANAVFTASLICPIFSKSVKLFIGASTLIP